MALKTVIKYQYFCPDCQSLGIDPIQIDTDWGDEPFVPKCRVYPTTHVIDPVSVSQIETISNNEVFIKDETTPTNGFIQSRGYSLNVVAGPGVNTSMDVSFPYPITFKVMNYISHTDIAGDTIDACVIPNYVEDGLVGQITSPLSSGSTSMTVDVSASYTIKPGFILVISDGVNSEEVGEVTTISGTTINFEFPTTQSFATGSMVKIRIMYIQDFPLSNMPVDSIGSSTFSGTYLPATSACRLVYTNNGSSSKVFKFYIGFKY